MTFEEWWDSQDKKFSENANPEQIRDFAKFVWEDAYKTGYSHGHHDGFADGKRAAMGIIDDTFDRYLAEER